MPADKRFSNSLAKKLYQLIICRLDGQDIRDRSYREKMSELAEKGVCGFIIFGGHRDEVGNFVQEVQSVSEIPLFIASDIERGVGQQIRGGTLFPCQMAVSAAVDRSKPEHVVLLRRAVGAIADEAKYIGINMPLIPVLDVNRDPDNPIICTRAFSDEPEDVAWFGSEYIDVLERSGLLSCAKHFPGHGDTSIDSHIMLPVIKKSVKDLVDTDIAPFKVAIKKGVSSIMVGHLHIPVLDDRPASLSRKIISGMLRTELGFDGLILTDALNMNALKGVGNVLVECLNAGADILLHPVDPDLAVKELLSAVESGQLAMETVEAAAKHIVKMKGKLGKTGESGADFEANEKLSAMITEMSLGLVKNTSGILPVRNKGAVSAVFAGDDGVYGASPLMRYFKKVFAVHDMKQDEKSGDGVLLGEIAVFAIFTSVSAWKGSSGISESEKKYILDIMRRVEHSIVISFGSPYVLRYFKEADILIAAYESTEQTQMAVLKCLEGQLDFQGRIPVKID